MDLGSDKIWKNQRSFYAVKPGSWGKCGISEEERDSGRESVLCATLPLGGRGDSSPPRVESQPRLGLEGAAAASTEPGRSPIPARQFLNPAGPCPVMHLYSPYTSCAENIEPELTLSLRTGKRPPHSIRLT